MPFLKTGGGKSSRGSRPGRASASMMSRTVGMPTLSRWATSSGEIVLSFSCSSPALLPVVQDLGTVAQIDEELQGSA